MILLRKVEIKNFLSYEDALIEFSEDAQISIEGPSGSGKSSIVDAIIWSLFGKGRSENRNLIRVGEKGCSVNLELKDGYNFYRIERSITAAKQSLAAFSSPDGENWSPIARTGLKDHQDWIERSLINSSYTLFINSIAYPQENSDSFVKQTATRRKDLLLEIARAADYDLYYNRARERSQLLSDSLIRDKANLESGKNAVLEALPIANRESDALTTKEALDGQILAKKGVLDGLKDQLRGYKALLAEKNAVSSSISEHDRNIDQCQGWISTRETKVKSLQNVDINEIEIKLSELQNLQNELSSLEEIERYNAERQTRLNAIISGKPVEYDHAKNIALLNKQLIEVLSHENTPCPDGKHCQCFGASYRKRAAEIESLLSDAMRDMRAQEQSLGDYSEKMKSVGEPKGDGNTYSLILEVKRKVSALAPFAQAKIEYESRSGIISTLEAEIQNMKKDIELFGSKRLAKVAEMSVIDNTLAQFDAEKLNREITAAEKEIFSMDEVRSDCIRIISLAKAAKENVEKYSLIVADLEKKIAKDQEDLDCIMLVKDAFGSKGIKTIMVDYLIPQLEYTINEILGQLSDFRVKLDTQKKSVDGESVIDGLFISIFNELGEELSFENYSGGQKLKISVAISEALASIQKVGFRIFDETFIGLDEASTDNFATVMSSLQSKFAQILCISHIRIIQDRFPDKITVQKSGNKSIITS